MLDVVEENTRGLAAVDFATVKAELRERGFATVRGLSDKADLERCRDLLEPLFDRRVGFKEGRQFDLGGSDDNQAPKLPQIIAPRRFEPKLEGTRTFKKAHEIAMAILGPDATLSFDHVIKKPAFDGAVTPWHQDEAFRDPLHDYDEISIWVPLQPVGSYNGCMKFVPLDGTGEILPHRRPTGAKANALECYAGFDEADGVECPLAMGDCTIHTGKTVHGAGPNLTGAPRYAYIMVFERPATKRKTPRDFPWYQAEDASRLARRRAWLLRGGFLVVWGRKARVAARYVRQGKLHELSAETRVKIKTWMR